MDETCPQIARYWLSHLDHEFVQGSIICGVVGCKGVLKHAHLFRAPVRAEPTSELGYLNADVAIHDKAPRTAIALKSEIADHLWTRQRPHLRPTLDELTLRQSFLGKRFTEGRPNCFDVHLFDNAPQLPMAAMGRKLTFAISLPFPPFPPRAAAGATAGPCR